MTTPVADPGRSSSSVCAPGGASQAQRPPRFVAIGGGTGLPVVLRGLADAQSAAGTGDPAAQDSLTAIVTVTDDGGSSGRLRRTFGMLPPGDIRNCLAALSSDTMFNRLLEYRFDAPAGLRGHPVGNLLLAALTQMTGCFADAVAEMGKIVEARGRVFPSTTENVTLRAQMATGEVVEGETAIARHPASVGRLELARQVRPWPEALRALINADVVVVGPGSLYTSILPNLLVDGVASTLSAVRAVRVCVANLMTEPGETDGLSLEDHMRVLRDHTGRDLFDYVVVNSTPPRPEQVDRYRGQGAELIDDAPFLAATSAATIVRTDLLDTTAEEVRHDKGKLAAALLRIARHGRRPSESGPRVRRA